MLAIADRFNPHPCSDLVHNGDFSKAAGCMVDLGKTGLQELEQLKEMSFDFWKEHTVAILTTTTVGVLSSAMILCCKACLWVQRMENDIKKAGFYRR